MQVRKFNIVGLPSSDGFLVDDRTQGVIIFEIEVCIEIQKNVPFQAAATACATSLFIAMPG